MDGKYAFSVHFLVDEGGGTGSWLCLCRPPRKSHGQCTCQVFTRPALPGSHTVGAPARCSPGPPFPEVTWSVHLPGVHRARPPRKSHGRCACHVSTGPALSPSLRAEGSHLPQCLVEIISAQCRYLSSHHSSPFEMNNCIIFSCGKSELCNSSKY